MSGRVAPAVGMILVVVALAGCAAPQEAANPLEQAFGAGNIGKNAGDATIKGDLLQGDAGAGWTRFPNATIMAPKISQTEKSDPATPGGGVTTALTAPAAGTPIKVRLAPGINTTGVLVSFAVKGPDRTQSDWTTPAAATDEATVTLTGIGTFEVFAKFDVAGHVAAAETPLAVNVNIIWTIESEVWPLAPGAPETWTCTPDAAPAGGCAYVTSYGAGVFVCAPDPVDCVGPPVNPPVPQTPRPPEYEKMADQFPFTIPTMDARLEVQSKFRGTYSPDQGTNIDLEFVGAGSGDPDSRKGPGFGMCVSNGGQPAADGAPTTPNEQDANEHFDMHPLAAGAVMLRIGGTSCPWLAYNNVGMVPYEATVSLVFGIPVPKCGGGPIGSVTETPAPKPTQGAADAQPSAGRPVMPGCMPPDVMEKRPPGLA